jgi:hypothetical protein
MAIAREADEQGEAREASSRKNDEMKDGRGGGMPWSYPPLTMQSIFLK